MASRASDTAWSKSSSDMWTPTGSGSDGPVGSAGKGLGSSFTPPSSLVCVDAVCDRGPRRPKLLWVHFGNPKCSGPHRLEA
ncbi:hypothetical protein ACFFX0_17975 [Citricoccus parietis]|uniref:Uncharacterized protein n=1 Tax=Citricoccus parietis TaxID=592307 RepID=A0ABV5G230_9MICC